MRDALDRSRYEPHRTLDHTFGPHRNVGASLEYRWFAPPLCQSEFVNVLWQALKSGNADPQGVSEMIAHFGRSVRLTPAPSPGQVLELALRARCATYDCEFIAAARALQCKVVTFDRKFRERFPSETVAPEQFQS